MITNSKHYLKISSKYRSAYEPLRRHKTVGSEILIDKFLKTKFGNTFDKFIYEQKNKFQKGIP